MLLLLLACAAGTESADIPSHIRIFSGTCDYVQFPENIQIDPAATYLLQICMGNGCGSDVYEVDEYNLIKPSKCPTGGTWKITEIKEG